jgi:rhodanese-related sulfurtransferase
VIRDLIKRTAKRAALRVFGMEWEASESEVPQHRPGAPTPYDPTVIPRVVEGSGDTPGPNHRTNIGRTWVSAQVVSGTPPFVLDLRPPRECAAGVIPGAHVLPLDQVRQRVDVLPDKAMRIIVYDQLGSDHADAVATWLREQGWVSARRLVGGFAEWIEHAEPVRVLEAPSPHAHAVGAMVQLLDTGDRGWVQDASLDEDGPRYTVWFEDGNWRKDVREGDLAA